MIAAGRCDCLIPVIRFVRAVLDGLRLALARDTLGEEEPAAGARPSPGVLHVLLVSREPLGTEPEAPPRTRRSILAALLAPEALPLDPEPPAPRRRGRLATLFAFERLDDSL